jgi:tRNA A37 threonylcarbamoyladenosine dehydratase
MSDRHARTRLLVGEDGLRRLQRARVAVIGLGGVGGYALEALARAGVGSLFLADAEVIDITNMNRQILALDNTVGRPKVDVARERVLRINPEAQVETSRVFISPDNVESVLPEGIRYAVDAIDSVVSKVALLNNLLKRGISFVSCMGAGNRLAATGIRVADISQTKGCPLARAVRQQLRKLGIMQGIRCVYAEETPIQSTEGPPETYQGKRINGTISYVPGIVGLTAAGVIMNDILGFSGRK